MTPEELIRNALNARESKGDLPTNDVDVALGWLTALASMVSDGKITQEAADEMRELSAAFAADYCVRRVAMESNK